MPNSSQIIPNPWITPEVINFIKQLLNTKPNANVLEFGSGCSTAFFTQYTKNLVTIEDNPKWHVVVEKYISDNNLNVDLRLVKSHYYQECTRLPKNHFDLILVDGRHRMNCIRYARDIIKPGGILMLDDSKYYEKYKEADEIMNDWQRFEITSKKRNPTDPNSLELDSTTTWWVKPS